MSQREHRRSEGGAASGTGQSHGSPGKRTLTGAIQMQQRPAGAVADQVPEQVELRRAGFSFEMPGGVELASSWSATASTRPGCTVNIEVSAHQLRLSVSPAVHIDATWPLQNMRLRGATYDFRTARTTVDVDTIGGLGEGMIDVTGTVEEKITEIITGAFAGSPVARRGYNPLNDPDLASTVARIQQNFQRNATGGAAPVGPGQMQRVAASVTVAARQQIEHGAGDASVRVAGGGEITLRVQGAGSVADIANAGGPGAAAAAARFESATVSSDAITVFHKGEAVVRLQGLTISRGGGVRVTDIELLGKAREWAETEQGVRFLIGLFGLAARGVPPEPAAHIVAHSDAVRATIVPGLTRATIEDAVANALRTFVAANPNPGGIDLAHILGMNVAAPAPRR